MNPIMEISHLFQQMEPLIIRAGAEKRYRLLQNEYAEKYTEAEQVNLLRFLNILYSSEYKELYEVFRKVAGWDNYVTDAECTILWDTYAKVGVTHLPEILLFNEAAKKFRIAFRLFKRPDRLAKKKKQNEE